MLLRFLTAALCATCVVLLATVPLVRISVIPPAAAPRPVPAPCLLAPGPPPLAVVDVAPGVAPSGIEELLHLGPGERITAVDDRALDEDLPVGLQLAALAPPPGSFLDLTVSSPSAERRVLVLLHGSAPPRTLAAPIEGPARTVTRRSYRSGFAP